MSKLVAPLLAKGPGTTRKLSKFASSNAVKPKLHSIFILHNSKFRRIFHYSEEYTNKLLNSNKLHKLHAGVVDTNFGSARVLEKNGFVLEGRFKDHYFIEGKLRIVKKIICVGIQHAASINSK